MRKKKCKSSANSPPAPILAHKTLCAGNSCKLTMDAKIVRSLLSVHFLLLLLLMNSANELVDAAANVTRIGSDGGELIQLPDDQPRGLAGRLLHKNAIQMRNFTNHKALSFSMAFVSMISSPPLKNSGYLLNDIEGLAFVIVPDNFSSGGYGAYLGLLDEHTNGNSSAHTFGVEVDMVKTEEFADPDYFHIGVDVNNMTSLETKEIDIAGGAAAQIWVEYHSPSEMLEVRMARTGQIRPASALLAVRVDLSGVMNDYMYVGFSIAWSSKCNKNGRRSTSCQGSVYNREWSFQTFVSDANATAGRLANIAKHSGMSDLQRSIVWVISVLAVTLLVCIALFLYLRWEMRRRWRFNVDASLHSGPHKFSYQELSIATKGFSPTQALGKGGFGSVYKGFLPGNRQEVAVKRVSPHSKQGEKEFLAEVQIIGRLRHRNLVTLQGWCQERGELLLVYDYMPGGSLDRLVFKEAGAAEPFSWENRMRAIQGIATALVYLHDECEQRIIHRDIKASNVMLDAKFNARLGDFGLARSYRHSLSDPESTHVAGTFGYLAPEFHRSGKATTKTDVYSYGAFLLEVACGKRPISSKPGGGRFLLVDWVWDMYAQSRLLEVADSKLNGVFDAEGMRKVLCLGLLCCHHDPETRPSMRQTLMVLTGDLDLPPVPKSKPEISFSDFEVMMDILDTHSSHCTHSTTDNSSEFHISLGTTK